MLTVMSQRHKVVCNPICRARPMGWVYSATLSAVTPIGYWYRSIGDWAGPPKYLVEGQRYQCAHSSAPKKTVSADCVQCAAYAAYFRFRPTWV